jgi:hypothetical protein
MRLKQEEGLASGIFIAHFDETMPQHKILNYVKFKCGKLDRVYGRQTTAHIINSTEANLFTDKFHLQGAAKGCVYFGLKQGSTLIAVGSFSKSNSERGNKDPNRWELRRLVFSKHVVGGASKILKHFIRTNPQVKHIISYSHNQWFDGNVYEKLGFTKTKELPPDYRYVKGEKMFHKGQFKHKAMKTKKDFNYNPMLTEHQNCLNNGYHRFYDCGKKKWEMKVNTQSPAQQ